MRTWAILLGVFHRYLLGFFGNYILDKPPKIPYIDSASQSMGANMKPKTTGTMSMFGAMLILIPLKGFSVY